MHDAVVLNPPVGPPGRRWGRGAVAAPALAAAAVAAALVPYLPAGPDLYAHLLWCWEVMRCLAAGALPVWLPDLNAGFGSPGIRLYSPLGPFVQGAVGVVLGSAGAALRAVPVLAWGGFLFVARRRRPSGGAGEWGILLAAPIVVYSLFGRGAWSEFLGVPLLWWLLDVAIEGDLAPARDGVVLGLLWLLHAPTTLMALVLMALAAASARDSRRLFKLALAAAVAGGLTAWHWLPLASEAGGAARAALTGGIFAAAGNVLGSPSAHALGESIWLGWCAVALMVALLAGRWWRTERLRTAAVLVAVAMASPLAAPLYAPASPLSFLQFPWRWLLPAVVLAASPLRRGLAAPGGRLALGALLLPLLAFPWRGFVGDPHLTTATTWDRAGHAVFTSLGGNPMLVDVAEHRPASWTLLAGNLNSFGGRDAALEGGEGSVMVLDWRPLERTLSVETARRTVVALRLLDYPFWQASLDGVAVPVHGSTGVVAVETPAGRHLVAVRWAGNPWSRVGLAVAAATGLALAWGRRRALLRRRQDGSDA